MKRVLSLVLACALFSLVAIPCLAVTSEASAINPRFAYIVVTNVDLEINQSINVTTNSLYCCTNDYYEIQATCKLQRYNNSKWNTVKTWTTSGMEEVSLSKSWAVPSGYTYRTYVTFYVYDDNGDLLETFADYDSVYFPAS